MLMGGRMEAGKDTASTMVFLTGENMIVEGKTENSSPPQRPQRELLDIHLKLASRGMKPVAVRICSLDAKTGVG